MKRKIAIYVFLLSVITLNTLHGFDHLYYGAQNNIPNNDFFDGIKHFASEGIKTKRKTTPLADIYKNNFNWHYYVTTNNLTEINNEHDAYAHYYTHGKTRKLSYCKPLAIVILLHLYDIDLMHEMIGRINYFINNNPHNTYHIKINIPIHEKLTELYEFNDHQNTTYETEITNRVTDLGGDTHTLRNLLSCDPILYNLSHYLQKSFVIPKQQIKVIFSENKGMDIGGFFVLLHELKKENLSFDFLIKLHTKKGNQDHGDQFGSTWKSCLMSFLNLKINAVLQNYNVLYPCIINSSHDPERSNSLFTIKKGALCSLLNINMNKEYHFAAGSMFLVPYAFFEIVQQWDLPFLYKLLVPGRSHVGYEHVFERLFGYIGEQVSTNIGCFSYIPCGKKHH